jgi:hypothetical protein
MERPVKTQPRVNVTRKFVGLCDDRLQRCANKCVTVSLASGQRARIAAKEGQVRGEFLAKGHI